MPQLSSCTRCKHISRAGAFKAERRLSRLGSTAKGPGIPSPESKPSVDKEKDYIYQLGQSDINLNIDTGQNVEHLDSLFTGNFLGHKSDIADGSLRKYEFRSFSNIVGDYYVAPRFMERIALHVAKNYLTESFGTKLRIPLILGIWGPKGTGKSFQTELTFKKMGLRPIVMSAGELEHEWAGTPGRLIRERYRRAASLTKIQGKMSCLLINDIDAGIGRFSNTQVTVNNQIVVGTLMNICDDPTRVSIGTEWRENDIIRRVPIIVTGNDFSKLFAPLIRDGRMEKFYWDPNDEELVEILFQMYKDDELSREDILRIRKTFPKQPLDFFGAMRAATYDNQIRRWIAETIGSEDFTDDAADLSILSDRLVKKEDLPDFDPVQLTVEQLLAEGDRLALEQQRINDLKLSEEYMRVMKSTDATTRVARSTDCTAMQLQTMLISHSITRFPIKAVTKQGLNQKMRASNKPSQEHFAPESPLEVIVNDLDYLERTVGVDFHPALETVIDVHDQMVCTLNPIVAEQRTQELDTKLQVLHEELCRAHEAIHKTEDRMNESLRRMTEMEQRISKLKQTHPELKAHSVATTPNRLTSGNELKHSRGIENNLDLSDGLKEHWYPVEFSSRLNKDVLSPMELFGEKWVLFRDKNGNASCIQDECAHRACPLSMGKIVGGNVQCPYHGWEYNNEGECVEMPSTRFCEGISIRSLPIAEHDGLVWIWPGEQTPTEIPACASPPDSFQIHAEMMLDVPVEHGLLLENLLDLAHAPFTHTSTFAKGWPIPDAVRFHTSKLLGGNWDPYPIDMSFETPCMVVSLIGLQQPGKIEKGVRATSCAHHLHQLHVCLPINDRTTKLLYRMSLDFLHWTRYIPGIQHFWADIAKQVLGEDLVLVQGQQDRMLRGASVWRNPVTYDKLGIRYRRWRNAENQNERDQAIQDLKAMSAAEIFELDDQTYCSS